MSGVLTEPDAAIVAGIIMLCEADSMKRDSSKKRSKLKVCKRNSVDRFLQTHNGTQQ